MKPGDLKPGDLLRVKTSLEYLYAGEEVPWDEDGYLVPGNISVPYGTIATVLGVVRKPKGDFKGIVYCKILTPGGVGWVWNHYVDEVG